MNQNGYGTLRVRVTEANGTIPVEGAVVQVSEFPETSDGRLLYSMRTDRDGLTPAVTLPAPPAGESLTPGAALPYTTYHLSVIYDGYYPVEGIGIPIFEGITAVQPVNLVPLTEEDNIAGAANGRVMIYEIPEALSLRPGGGDREDIGNGNGTVSGGVQ